MSVLLILVASFMTKFLMVLDNVGCYGFSTTEGFLMDWIHRHNVVLALHTTFGVGESSGGGSHFLVKGYQGFSNQPRNNHSFGQVV